MWMSGLFPFPLHSFSQSLWIKVSPITCRTNPSIDSQPITCEANQADTDLNVLLKLFWILGHVSYYALWYTPWRNHPVHYLPSFYNVLHKYTLWYILKEPKSLQNTVLVLFFLWVYGNTLSQCYSSIHVFWLDCNSPIACIGHWGMAVMAIIWLINEWVRVFPQSRGEEIYLAMSIISWLHYIHSF